MRYSTVRGGSARSFVSAGERAGGAEGEHAGEDVGWRWGAKKGRREEGGEKEGCCGSAEARETFSHKVLSVILIVVVKGEEEFREWRVGLLLAEVEASTAFIILDGCAEEVVVVVEDVDEEVVRVVKEAVVVLGMAVGTTREASE